MKVEFLKGWRHYRPGQTITPGRGVADILIRRGLAKLVETESPKPLRTFRKQA